MRKLITLIYSLLLGSYTMAQNNIVNIDFEVEGINSVYKNAVVKFISNKDTINTNIENGKLTIPKSVFRQRVTVIFLIDNYFLKFDSIPVTLNTLYPKWTIGVDIKPFDKKKFVTVKSWRKIEIIYYLKNTDGRTFTVDRCKKSTVIKR